MFTSRSGRVTVEQQSDRVSISIRTKRGWILLLLILILVVAVVILLSIFLGPHGGDRARARGADPLPFVVSWSVAIAYLAWKIAWSLGGKYSILLSPTELRLSTTIFGISLRQRVTPTSEVRNLRFVPVRGRTLSRITCEDTRGTAKIASDLDELESKAVLDVMQTFQLFPDVSSRQSTR